MVYGLYTAVGSPRSSSSSPRSSASSQERRHLGGEKALWVVLTICFPFLGSLIYFTVRRGW